MNLCTPLSLSTHICICHYESMSVYFPVISLCTPLSIPMCLVCLKAINVAIPACLPVWIACHTMHPGKAEKGTYMQRKTAEG